MLLGLGVPEWLTIAALVGGLVLTLKMMGRASSAYERRRRAQAEQEREPGEEAR